MPPTTKKSDKSEVNYRKGGDHCGMCKFYDDDDGTDEVEGEDGEYGWCQIVKGRIGEDDQCDDFKYARGSHVGTATEGDDE